MPRAPLGVSRRDVERQKPLPQDGRQHIGRDVPRPREPAETRFGGQLPGGGRTDVDDRRGAGDDQTGPPREPPVAIEPPEEGMSVDEDSHPSPNHCRSSFWVSGSKNALVTRARPFIAPNWRRGAGHR